MGIEPTAQCKSFIGSIPVYLSCCQILMLGSNIQMVFSQTFFVFIIANVSDKCIQNCNILDHQEILESMWWCGIVKLQVGARCYVTYLSHLDIEYNWNNLVNPKMLCLGHVMNTTFVLTTYMWCTIYNRCLYLTSVFLIALEIVLL